MVKDDAIIVIGEVKENLGPWGYRVWLPDYGMDVTATLSWKMKHLHRIRVLPWDFVDVELNPYDVKKGRIVYRHNQKRWVPNQFTPRNTPAAAPVAAPETTTDTPTATPAV